MKITLCYSMQYAEKAKEMKEKLEELGHEAHVSATNNKYLGKSDEEKEEIKLEQKYGHDAIAEHGELIRESDAILVLNYDKHGIENYIGGNAFLEMGLTYFLGKKIYLLNPIPKMPHYETELIALKPVILDGDLEKI